MNNPQPRPDGLSGACHLHPRRLKMRRFEDHHMTPNDMHRHFTGTIQGPERITEAYNEAKRFCDSQPWHMGTNWHALAVVGVLLGFWGALAWFML